MDAERLRKVFDRKERVLRAKPAAARARGSSTARLVDGLACDVTGSGHVVRADMPSEEEGTNTGPTPGQLMRASVAACLAIGYRLWATRRGLVFAAVEVEMTCELDVRGQLGIGDDVPTGWDRIAYTVRITSDASEDAVREAVDYADRRSPLLGSLDKAIRIERTLEIRRPARSGSPEAADRRSGEVKRGAAERLASPAAEASREATMSVEARFHRRVQRYGWDLAATTYDQAWVPILAPFGAGCVERAHLRPGERVLDVATGTGTVAVLAAETVGPSGHVLGTDISDKMVAAAGARGLPQLRYARADMEATGLEDASFDVVLCAFGLMYAADTGAAAAEMARLLKPGGRLVVSVWGRRDRCGWREVFPITDRRVSSEVCPLFYGLGVPGALAGLFERAGLTEAREERIEARLDWSSAEAAADAIFIGGPVALAYSKFTPEVREEVRREYLESIAAYRRGERYEVPAEFVYGMATKG